VKIIVVLLLACLLFWIAKIRNLSFKKHNKSH